MDSIDTILKKATELAREKSLGDAADLVEGILKEQPDNLRAINLMGFIRYFQQDFHGSEACNRRALEISPEHPYALKGLGLCLARQGKVEEGISFLKKSISAKPNWVEPYWDLAVVLKDEKRYDEALAILEVGIEKVPSSYERLNSFKARIRKRM